MKYISVIAFAMALSWSWNVIHSKGSQDFETHVGIQDKLIELIQQTIKEKKPSSGQVNIEKIWTESAGEDKIKAHFMYSFQETNTNQETTETEISGEALLQKQPDDENGNQKWTLLSVKASNDSMVFEQGITVIPGKNDIEEAPATSTAPSDEAPKK